MGFPPKTYRRPKSTQRYSKPLSIKKTQVKIPVTCYLILIMRSAIEETANSSSGRRNWRPHAQTVRVQNEVASKENSMAVPQNIKNILTIWSNNSTMVMPKKPKSRVSKRYLYTMFTAALFLTAKSWKQPTCPLTETTCGIYPQ